MVSFFLTLFRLLKALLKAFKEPLFLSLLMTLLLIVLSGTLFYRSVEGWETLDAIYFAFVSLVPTGVETGFMPQTDFGKVFTMLYLTVGVGVMLILLISIGKFVLDFSQEDRVKYRQRAKK